MTEHASTLIAREAQRLARWGKMTNAELAREVKQGHLAMSKALRLAPPAPEAETPLQMLMHTPFAGLVGAYRRLHSHSEHNIIAHMAPIGQLRARGDALPACAKGYIVSVGNQYIVSPAIFGIDSDKAQSSTKWLFATFEADKTLSAIRRAMLFAEDIVFTRANMVLREQELVQSLLADKDVRNRLYNNPRAWDILCGWASKLGLRVEETTKTPQEPVYEATGGGSEPEEINNDDITLPEAGQQTLV